MVNIFYKGSDGLDYGPVTEADAQGWYVSGYFNSDIQFKFSSETELKPDVPMYTLGELIRLNGRPLPFHFSPETANREAELDARHNQLVQEVASLGVHFNLANNKSGQIFTLLDSRLALLTQEVEGLKGRDNTSTDLTAQTITALDHRLDLLIQEVASLKGMDNQSNGQYSDPSGDMGALKHQVNWLLEAHTALERNLNETSSQKEICPVDPQVGKKVNELKKRMEEHEKNFASMKKELSAVNSKCDRTEAKLEKLAAGQESTKDTVKGYDKRIAALKSTETSIRESIKECEKNFVSSSSQLKSIQSELSGVKMEVKKEKELIDVIEWFFHMSSDTRNKLKTVKERLDEMSGSISELEIVNDRLDGVEDLLDKMNEDVALHAAMLDVSEEKDDELKKEIGQLKGKIEQTIQNQMKPVVATLGPIEACEEEDVAPWNEKEKVTVDAPVDAEEKKNKENCPWDANESKGSEVKKGGIDVQLKNKECCPWEKAEVGAVRNDERPPWESHKSLPVSDKRREMNEPDPWN